MANAVISSDPNRKIGQPKMGARKWLLKVGWKHVLGLVISLYAAFPILYILSTSLTTNGAVDSGVLFGEFSLNQYRDLLFNNTPDRPFTRCCRSSSRLWPHTRSRASALGVAAVVCCS